MVKKIKFPLEMAGEVKVRTLEELREHFDLEKAIAYYMDGKLLTWLNERYYENEAQQISQLDKDVPGFKKNLCEILGVDIKIDCDIDFEAIERHNVKLSKLKQFTSDSKIIRSVDSVAFDQEELSDLLDEDVSPIYLCGERFNIPLSKENVTYIGVNSPVAFINSKTVVNFASKNIQFQDIPFNEEYLKLTQQKDTFQKETATSYKNSEMKLNDIEIYKQLPQTNCKECGLPTCLAFAMAMANGKANLDMCPHVSMSAKESLGFTTKQPEHTANSENKILFFKNFFN